LERRAKRQWALRSLQEKNAACRVSAREKNGVRALAWRRILLLDFFFVLSGFQGRHPDESAWEIFDGETIRGGRLTDRDHRIWRRLTASNAHPGACEH